MRRNRALQKESHPWGLFTAGAPAGLCAGHGKRLYASRKQAKIAIRKLPDSGGMRPYLCTEVDGMFHIGHTPEAVRRGQITAREWYEGA